jgi:CRP/FNR family cyclic AMP-dependent transcriptional regulator
MSILKIQTPTVNPTLERFLEHCHRKRYPNRSVIFHAGDPPDTLYYIIQGSVRVMLEDDFGHELVLAYLNKGDFFGEMGLFGTEQRSALVVARENCEVAEMSYTKFRHLAQQDPAPAVKLSTLHFWMLPAELPIPSSNWPSNPMP